MSTGDAVCGIALIAARVRARRAAQFPPTLCPARLRFLPGLSLAGNLYPAAPKAGIKRPHRYTRIHAGANGRFVENQDDLPRNGSWPGGARLASRLQTCSSKTREAGGKPILLGISKRGDRYLRT